MEHTLDTQFDCKSVIIKNLKITDQFARTQWSLILKGKRLINFAMANCLVIFKDKTFIFY